MSADGGAGGDWREMEVDHRVLAGGVAETLRCSSAGYAWRIQKGPHSTTPRVDERWNSAATTYWRDSGACRVFADRLWPLGGAFSGGHSSLGQSAYGAIDNFGFGRRFNHRNQTKQKNVRQKNE